MQYTYTHTDPKTKPFKKTLTFKKSVLKGRREYLFGFNGQEKDDEVAGSGNSMTAQYWQYDTRLGRRWNVDPAFMKYPAHSPYIAFLDNPLYHNDPYGDDPITGNKKGDRSMRKYARKMRRMSRKKGITNQANLHGIMEATYNNKKWMWVKDKKDLDRGGSNHPHYYHAGDLFRINNPNSNTAVTNTSITTTTLLAESVNTVFANDGSMHTVRRFDLPNGLSNISFNISSSDGNWTANLRQGRGAVSSYADLISRNSLSGNRTILEGQSKVVTSPIIPANGDKIYFSFTTNSLGSGSGTRGIDGTTSASATIAITRTFPAIRQATSFEVVVTTGKYITRLTTGQKQKNTSNKNPNRLNAATIEKLNRSRNMNMSVR